MPELIRKDAEQKAFDFGLRMLGDRQKALFIVEKAFSVINQNSKVDLYDCFHRIIELSRPYWSQSTERLRNPGLIDIDQKFSEAALRKLEAFIGGLDPASRSIILLFHRLGFDLKQIQHLVDFPLARVSQLLNQTELNAAKVLLPEISAETFKQALKDLPEHEYHPLVSMPATRITQGLEDLSGRQGFTWKRPFAWSVLVGAVVISLYMYFRVSS